MKILVTGGGGFVGKALALALKKDGHSVISLSRGFYPDLKEAEIDQMQVDLLDREALFTSFKGVELVFHVAAKAGFWGPYSEYYGINVLGSLNVIDACLHNGVGHLVFTSSASVVFDGDDITGGNEELKYPKHGLSHYTETKAFAEKAILMANSDKLKTMSIRPHLVWGPGDHHILPRIIEQAKSGQLKIIGKGKNVVDTTYIDNCTEAHLCALRAIKESEAWGKAYFISDDSPVKLWEMLNKLLVASGCEKVEKRISTTAAIAAANVLLRTHNISSRKVPPRITPFLIHELSASHWFDISAAKEFLGYKPVVTIEEGLNLLSNRSPSEVEGGDQGIGRSGDQGTREEQRIYSLDYLRKVNRLEGKRLSLKSLRFGLRYLRKTNHLIKDGTERMGKEASETKEMANIFFRMLETKLDLKNRKEPPTEEEVKEAIEQLKDVGRFSLFATISILPGGGFSLIGLELLARKFGIKGFTLVPSSFRKGKK